MGQWYTVKAVFKFKNGDPSLFCEIFTYEVAKRDGVSARFDLTKGSLADPFGCFKILTTADPYQYSDDDGVWTADFDGSYGWYGVLFDVFRAALSACEDGSYVEIYPDSGCTRLFVEHGVVHEAYEDEDEEEDG